MGKYNNTTEVSEIQVKVRSRLADVQNQIESFATLADAEADVDKKKEMKLKVKVAKKSIKYLSRTSDELKKAKDILRYTKQRHANKKVYLEFMNLKKKARFRREHEPEIMLYEAATRELKKLLSGKPVPSEKKTWARIKELSSKKNVEYEELRDQET